VKALYKRLIFAAIALLVLLALTPFMGAIKRKLLGIKFIRSKPDLSEPKEERKEMYRLPDSEFRSQP
jgi:hypothetical protein